MNARTRRLAPATRAAVRAGSASALALAFLLALGAAAGVPRARAQAGDYLVGPGDVLDMEIHAGGQKQDQFAVTVSAEGNVACPLIGEVSVGGCTAAEIARRISEALGRGYYVDPHVLVSVRESAGRVRVVGEVQHPGIYPIHPTTGALTVMSACDLAGGLTDYAAARRVRLCRTEAGRQKLYTLDLVRVRQGKAEDVTLRSGDRIEIPRRWF